MAIAVANIFRAVPPMVWSAFRLMEAKASNSENTMPESAATKMEMVTITSGGNVLGSMATARTPPRPPITIMPSRAILMMPECSLNMPPSATSMSTMPYKRVYLISSSISLTLLLGLRGRFRIGIGCVLIRMHLLGNQATEQHSESTQINDDAGNQIRNLSREILCG